MATNDNDLIARLRREKIEPDRPIKPAPIAQIRSTRRRGFGVRMAVVVAAAATLAVIAGTVGLVQQNEDGPTPASPSPSPTSTNEPGTGDPGTSSSQKRPCAIDEPAADAGESVVTVYFLCQKSWRSAPAYRSVSGGPDERAQAALETYFAGPSKAERRVGLTTPIGRSLANVPTDITIRDGIATISFGSLAHLRAMTPTQRDFFIEDLSKTVRSLDGVRQLQLTLDGSCKQFWKLAAESICMPIS